MTKNINDNNNWVTYKNGNCIVRLNTVNGTKIRFTPDDEFNEVFPESMDIKITNYCDKGCPWCHENSTTAGKHSDIDQEFLNSLHPFEEIAVGGGNVLEHPKLVDYLLKLKEKKCIPSITLNQTHFMANLDEVEWLKKNNLVYGIGISLEEPTEELINALKKFPTAVLHTIAGILTEEDVKTLANNHLKLLILGYKFIRRGVSYKQGHEEVIENNIKWLGDNLTYLFNSFDVVSFDNLALEQLPVREAIGEKKWQEFYMGDDGQHTFYIDMVEKEYALSSTSLDRFPIGNKTIDEMFAHIKSLSEVKSV